MSCWFVLGCATNSLDHCTGIKEVTGLNPARVRVAHKAATVKSCVKEHVFGGFRLILFLDIGSFLQNQKMFLKVS